MQIKVQLCFVIQVSKIAHLTGHKGPVYALEKADEANGFLSAGADGILVSWTLGSDEGKALADFQDAVFVLKKVVASADSSHLLAGCKSGLLYIFNLDSKSLIKAIDHHKTSVFAIAQMGEFVFTGDESGQICKWSLSMDLIFSAQLSRKSIRHITSIGNHTIAVACSDHKIYFLDENLKVKETQLGHHSSVFGISFSPKTEYLFSVGRDAQLIKHRFETKDDISKVNAHLYPIHSISMSPDEQFLATGSMDKSIRIWEAESMKLLKVIDFEKRKAHTSSVNQIIWLNNQTIVSCSDDRTVQVFEIEKENF